MRITAVRGRVVTAIVVAVVVIVAGQLLWSALRPLFGFGSGSVGELVASDLVAFPAALLALLVWVRFVERRAVTDLRPNRVRRPLRWVLAGAVLAVVLLLFANVVVGQFMAPGGDGGGPVEEPAGPGAATALALLAAIAVQASAEELVFRGYLMTSLLGDLGRWPAVLVSSAVFGLCHSLNPGASAGYVAATAALGLLLGVIALGPGGLWMSCAFHTAWNAVQAVPTAGEPGAERDGAGTGIGALIWLFVALVLCYAAVAALLLRRSTRRAASAAA